MANRDIYDDTFDSIGDAIVISRPETFDKYAIEISGNSQDESKKCQSFSITKNVTTNT